MNEGRPLFQQADPEAPAEEAAPEQETPVAPKREVDPVGNKLKFSDSYSDVPFFAGQAKVYPDSVKIVSEHYMVFDVSNPQDMEKYSTIRSSDREHSKYRIMSDERIQWHEQRSTWLVLMLVQERMFKTIYTNQTDPSSP